MKRNLFIEGIPVVENTKAHDYVLGFQNYLRTLKLKGVNYRTGMKCGAWSLDVYLIPENDEKPFFQKKCNGDLIISKKYGYFVSGLNNDVIEQVEYAWIQLRMKELAYDFILNYDYSNFDDIDGKTFREMLGTYDNCALNQDIELYLEANDIELNNIETDVLIGLIYDYRHPKNIVWIHNQ